MIGKLERTPTTAFQIVIQFAFCWGLKVAFFIDRGSYISAPLVADCLLL